MEKEEKYKNKYRSASARAQWWDYGWNAAYFVTICTKNRAHYFGDIQNGKMVRSHVGVLADVLWHEIKHHAKFVELDAFVVMPNHVHGIFIFDQPGDGDGTAAAANDQSPGQKRFRNQGKNTLSSVVGSYKSAVTKHARRLGYEFAWQTRFYDHIIRNEASFQRIATYIENNVKNWKGDKFYE
jgi:REP element-mobilizing transposase RayT